ncbi:hypothetical protein O181_124266 [Austropuccinia psidii MF-1]|uniref:Uncharacterized protein n=1 Tax=Austropuccinia psidii MF-1 TaxID=1389203 RepID=A0A9Q3KQ38_9BASI|nr:hypothetical protein [Austropuccinia psidii MF-1]
MTDLSHKDNNQVLMKEAPQLKECPKFKGEGEYDHMSLIKTIYMLEEEYAIPGESITARLHSSFEKSAKRWYYGIRQNNGKDTWSFWKNEIITKWENDAWRYKIEKAFENSFFYPHKNKSLTWFLKKVEILNALYPETSQKMVHKKTLKRCGGEIEHALRTKINGIVETDDPNDKEEESDSQNDTEESETSERDEINTINAQINNIDLIYEVLDVNSNLPQVGTSHTILKSIQDSKLYETKPAKGIGSTAGKSRISIVIVENQEAKVNLETGAYCL